MNPKKSERFRTVLVRSWSEFREIACSQDFRSWAFRGQANAGWPLFSSLSRHFLSFGVHPSAWTKQESRVIRIFQRKSHLFLDHLPADVDSFEWLTLMQHHGAPTRLLDFSWSPFVAAFFALERATETSAVWAVLPPAMNDAKVRPYRGKASVIAGEMGPWNVGAYEEHFLPNRHRFAVIGEPYRMNQRLIAQAGTFVMPSVLHVAVEDIVPTNGVVKFILDESIRKEALRDLYTMNINNATLFPGIDGLARSMAFELEHHWAFDPTTMQKHKGFRTDGI